MGFDEVRPGTHWNYCYGKFAKRGVVQQSRRGVEVAEIIVSCTTQCGSFELWGAWPGSEFITLYFAEVLTNIHKIP